MHKLYNRFIKPISKDSDQAEREIVLNFLLSRHIGFVGHSFGRYHSSAGNFWWIRHIRTGYVDITVIILFVVGLYVASTLQAASSPGSYYADSSGSTSSVFYRLPVGSIVANWHTFVWPGGRYGGYPC